MEPKVAAHPFNEVDTEFEFDRNWDAKLLALYHSFRFTRANKGVAYLWMGSD